MERIAVADFDWYGVVAYAPPAVHAEVEGLRRLLPPSGRPVFAAHVTIKGGTFRHPTNFDLIVERIQACCQAVRPATVVADHVYAWESGEHASLALGVEAPALTDLHRRLIAALDGLCETICSPDLEDRFTPHLTLAQQFPAAELEQALAMLRQAPPRFTFEVEAVSLDGSRGGPVFEKLRRFPLGRA